RLLAFPLRGRFNPRRGPRQPSMWAGRRGAMPNRPRRTGARTGRSRPSAPVLQGETGLQLALEPFGPGPKRIQQLEAELLEHPTIRNELGRARWRLLTTGLLEAEPPDKRKLPPASDRFIATIYDYTNNRTLSVTGGLRAGRRLSIAESGVQPWPTYEEFSEAVRILRRDRHLGPALREQRLRPYPPMPPLVAERGRRRGASSRCCIPMRARRMCAT